MEFISYFFRMLRFCENPKVPTRRSQVDRNWNLPKSWWLIPRGSCGGNGCVCLLSFNQIYPVTEQQHNE